MIKMKEESEAGWLLSKKVYKGKKGAQLFSMERLVLTGGFLPSCLFVTIVGALSVKQRRY